MNEIERYNKVERAWNGKPVRSTDEQIIFVLRPMFATYPQAKVNEDMTDMYVKMLRDIDPTSLAKAVLQAMSESEFLPTIAAIRKAAQGEERAPGPRSEVQLEQRRMVPPRMFHLDPEEDKRQRMERLRQTKDWGKYYD